MPTPPLIAPTWRRWALLTAILAAGVVAAMAVALHGVNEATGADDWANRLIFGHIGSAGVARFLLRLSTPEMSIGALAAIAVVAALVRRWEVTALCVIGPSLALFVTEMVLKPVVDRSLYAAVLGVDYHVGLAYPSGHETGLASLLVVLGLLLARVPLPAAARVIGVLVLVVWAALAAIGLVRGHYHYPTDTVGGMGVALAIVIGTALAIDVVTAQLDARPRRAQLT